MTREKTHILLVEDDESLGYMLKDNLRSNGWSVKLCPNGALGLTAFHNEAFDICVFDVMLPKMDGFTLAEKVRKVNIDVPIIFLTARGMDEDRLKGFELGADDYITKPFSIQELIYRIEAILKRTYGLRSSADKKGILQVGNTTLYLDNHILEVNGKSTKLTNKEANIIKLFFLYPGKLIERETFLKSIWQDDGFFVARSMDVFVSKIRKHLRPDAALSLENVRGVGYILNVKK